ncbi:MFS-type transporter dbaD [Pseudocercospora fuligena]|uniref:MFS-type transporter dbaD n=1 Tax=Pseudocercospora fuligena TaxID=685502 RepID=A0A8H6RGQ5_9PEZI|nr:MFS-type transporter dbaD [Pseudocercospora fuligena]
MKGSNSAPQGHKSESSFFDSRSTSDKSDSINQTRSNSKVRDGDDLGLTANRTISFDSRDDEKKDDSPSRSPSCYTASGRPNEIETPNGPVQRDVPTALGSASVLNTTDPAETGWPRDWRAYVCLFGGFLLMFNSWGLVNTYGTYSSYYMQNLLPGRDLLLLNLVGSTQSFVVLALSAPVGRFLDAGYIQKLLIAGTILVSIGSFTLSVVNGDGGYNQGNYGLIWLTQGLISGLGMACFFVSSSQVVSTYFKAKKGTAIGIVASGASISGLLYPMMTRYLIENVGFNNAARGVAGVVCGTCIIAIFAAQPNPKHEFNTGQSFRKLDTFIDSSAFKNPAFLWLCAAISFLFFGFYAVFFNLEEWAVSEGFGYREATQVGANAGLPHNKPDGTLETFWLLATMNATSTLGRVGSAYLCDHFGALNVHTVVTFVGSLLVLILWTMANTLNSAIAFVVLFGAFSGAVIGLPPASVADILGKLDTKKQMKLGQWTGMMYSCSAVFALTGPVIAGHLVTEYSTFITVQCWSGACMFMSACCMAMGVLNLQKERREWTSIWHPFTRKGKASPQQSSASSMMSTYENPVKEEV